MCGDEHLDKGSTTETFSGDEFIKQFNSMFKCQNQCSEQKMFFIDVLFG